MGEKLSFLERNRLPTLAERVIGQRRKFLVEQTKNAIQNIESHLADNRQSHGPFYLATNQMFEPEIKRLAQDILTSDFERQGIPRLTEVILEGTEPTSNSDNFDLNNNSTGNWDLQGIIDDTQPASASTNGLISIDSEIANLAEHRQIQANSLIDASSNDPNRNLSGEEIESMVA